MLECEAWVGRELFSPFFHVYNSDSIAMPRRLFQKGDPKPEKSGRKPGQRNHTTEFVKDTITGAFDKLGGIERLVKWANKSEKNLGAFYTKIWVKIIPLQVTGLNGKPIELSIEDRTQMRAAILEIAAGRRTIEAPRDTQRLPAQTH